MAVTAPVTPTSPASLLDAAHAHALATERALALVPAEPAVLELLERARALRADIALLAARRDDHERLR